MTNNRVDKIYEYKAELLKEFSKFPTTKRSAKVFVAIRIKQLKKELANEKSVRKKGIIKKIIKMYEEVK